MVLSSNFRSIGWKIPPKSHGLETTPARHTMMTSSNGNIFRVTGPLWGEFTGHRWIPHTRASDSELSCFYLICVWINGWVNNGEAGDLRRHRAHYDIIMTLKWRHMRVMASQITITRTRLFIGQFAQATNKRNIKASLHWLFESGINRRPVTYIHRGPVLWRAFPWHDGNMWII